MRKKCLTCKKYFYKKPSDSKIYWEKRKYCKLQCSNTTFKKGVSHNKGSFRPVGQDSPKFKTGRNISKNGYIRVLIVGTSSYEYEHRKVMEIHLGRKLLRSEHVHHINKNKQDNRIENLELLDIHEHNKMHTKERWNSDKPFRKSYV
jgi:hypothetical protein